MPTTRTNRIVRRAVMVLAGVVLIFTGWLVLREPPEIERSRGIKLGMTPLEVEAVMQTKETGGLRLPDGREMRMFGAGAMSRSRLKNRINEWTGTRLKSNMSDYPVRVRFDANWRADRIERGDEVEEVRE